MMWEGIWYLIVGVAFAWPTVYSAAKILIRTGREPEPHDAGSDDERFG